MANGWFYRNRMLAKTFIRVVFGAIWLIDGSLKFQPGTADAIAQMIQTAAQGMPAFLTQWFGFWSAVVGQAPVFWVSLIGTFEILLGLALVFGVLRKTIYSLGILLSLFIWAVPEAFGGPYGPGATDIGTAAIYALVFLALISINAGYGPSKLSVDYWLEKRIKWWHRFAEFGSNSKTRG